MKIYKNLLPLLMALLAFVACGEQDAEDYQPGSAQGEQVYFRSDLASSIETPMTASSFTVSVNRVKTDDEITVPVTVTMSDGSIYSVSASSVTFKAGEKEAQLTFSYDPANVVYGTYYDISLAIGDTQYTTEYGASTYEFKAGLTEWVDMSGKASYREDLLTTFFGVDNSVYDVEIQKSVVTDGRYRLKNVYTTSENPLSEDESISFDRSNDYDMIIDASDPNYVYIEGGYTGMDLGYGQCYVTSMVDYYLQKGNSLEDIKAAYPGLFGTLKNGVVTMPKNSMLIGMEDYNDLALYYANANNLFAVALPGSVIADYSLSYVTSGTYVGVDKSEYTCGVFTFGEDVTSVKYALTDDESKVEEVAAGIIDGTVESTEITAAGEVRIPVDKTGTYYLVIVGYNGSEAVATTYTAIKFKSTKDTAEKWTPLYEGVYTYNAQALQDGASSFFDGDDDAVLYQSESDATRFKIAPWANSEEGLIFTQDPETGEFCVDAVDTGAAYQGAEVYASCYSALTGKTSLPCGYSSTNKSVINFYLFYHLSDGNGFGVVLETFEITGNASASSVSNAMKAPKGSFNTIGHLKANKMKANLKIKANIQKATI